MTNAVESSAQTLPSSTELLAHWEGHRRLTRRTIERFPTDALFTFTPAPPMRPFGTMMLEVLGMVQPTLHGLLHGVWERSLQDFSAVETKEALLAAWDETGSWLQAQWAVLPAQRLADVESVYGMPRQTNVHVVLYLLDNEVHHRAQGFVYLRLLGIEPPAFYER
ncbi:DinB family protein [Deinococcus peraridilitoris]|uniref:Damage-inducible protein DinB n=1 Tax=Deinococcus peraridilitoris (strain DSM 19664 / LMG 22246 / CIP 109416 / KR-200) TaxID=937777 RepID=L0A3V2_DEIPD|nr:DinB family protein [Deinococcus peraridilitoris]AFZ67872.1 hypothetical protein Deipe_2396 [Deinococcus peraridilitoris DSM 19664]